MTARIENVMEAIGRLSVATEALAAVGARLKTETENGDLDPAVRVALDGVCGALGIDPSELSPQELRTAAGAAQSFFLQASDLLADRPPGWTYEDDAVLSGQGQQSAAFAEFIAEIAPQLEGLSDALTASADAAFCDVGSGVAALSIALARRWPSLRVVGLEPFPPAMRLGKENVAAAGLGDRIELRPQAVQDLADEEAFDAVWLAGPFLPPDVLEAGLERSKRALRRGGWALFGTYPVAEEELAQKVRCLRIVRWGGAPLEPEDVEQLLRGVGLADVRTISGSWKAPVAFTVGRRS